MNRSLALGAFAFLVVVAAIAGYRTRPTASGGCIETPAQDRWPQDYARARGQKDIWLVDGGGAHHVNEQRKVAWRVVGAVDRLDVAAKRLDGPETFALSITDRVMPNGRDEYPKYWDSVSYLTFPAAGCWQLNLQAGDKHEQITLDVR